MKKLVFVTGTRAEYGLLRPVLQKAFSDPELECQLLVTGAHLREDFGTTVNEIERDGFPIAAKLDILRFGHSREAVVQSVGLAVRLFGEWFATNPCDACVLLGDRYEMFAVASAAMLQNVPVVHISGGDVTYGAQDDAFRHCITKMASLHFPYCEQYRLRLLRMGEEPERVFNVGALGAENIHELKLLSKEELSEKFGFDFKKKYALVTYHPETLSSEPPKVQLSHLLTVLEEYPDLGLCITKANADVGGFEINAVLEQFAKRHARVLLVSSMGVQGYLSAMKGSCAVIGNSSSGVVETPEFGVPCVNIGQRQAGRIQCKNVISCEGDAASIRTAMAQALSPAFQSKASRTQSPFYRPDTSGKILELTKNAIDSGLLRQPKRFFDGDLGMTQT